jgi:hypothetical protein
MTRGLLATILANRSHMRKTKPDTSSVNERCAFKTNA